MERDGVLRKRALVVAGVVAATLAVMGVALVDPSPGPESSASASEAAATSSTTSTTVAASSVPVNPRGLSGWGTAQPNAMSATVQHGTSNTRLTPEERAKWAAQLVQVRAAAEKVNTVRKAEAAGYVRNFQYVDGRGYEYINWDYLTDRFDIDHPSMLNFPSDEPDTGIASVAYQVRGTKEAGPPDVFPLSTVPWHYHTNLCRKGDSIIGNVETAPDGTLYKRQQERCDNLGAVAEPELNHWMVDLWVVPGWENPWGLVSSKHPDLFRSPVPWFTTSVTGASATPPEHH